MNIPLVVARGVQYLSSWVMAGGFAFLAFVLPRDRGGPTAATGSFLRWLRICLAASAVLSIASATLWSCCESAAMNDLPIGDAWHWDAMGPVLQETNFGHICLVRIGLEMVLAGFVAVVCLSSKAALSRPVAAAAWLVASVDLAALAQIGHAAASRSTAFVASDIVHLVASGVWPGSLVPLLLFLVAATKSRDLLLDVPIVTCRFSNLSLFVVATLTASGLINATSVLPSVGALWHTRYGVFLLIKLALFLLMLLFAALNLLRVTPNLAFGEEPNGGIFAALRRNVSCEVVIGIAIAGVVAMLGMTAPPR